MASSDINIGALRAVSDRLDSLGLDYAFVGGSIVNLLLDNPDFVPARATDDVDVILEIVTGQRYSDVEEKIRRLGFSHDTREKAPLCRWILSGITVDIMPVDGDRLGLNTIWFPEALASATEQEFLHTKLRLVSPTAFLATKFAAFADRGKGDYYGSHDLEDFLTVIDGRDNIIAEVNAAPAGLRDYLRKSIAGLLAVPQFDEALPSHLPGDSASQDRLPLLREKLRALADNR